MESIPRSRLSLRLSRPVMAALTLTAEKNGLPVATQAMWLLRQSLARTMESREFVAWQQATGTAGMTRKEWIAEQQIAAEMNHAEEAEARAAARDETAVQ